MQLIILKVLFWKRLRNTKYFSYSVLAFGFCFLLSSCGKEMEIEIDIREKPASLVVNSTLVPFNVPIPKFLGIELSSSISIFDTISPSPIKNATVLLYKNNVFVDTLQYNSNHKMYPLGYTKPFEGPLPGDIYEINILAEGFRQISAKTTIPEKVEIISFQIIPVAFIDELGGAWSEVILTFKDPPGISNYYEIVVGEIDFDPTGFFSLFSYEKIITEESYYPSTLRIDLKKPYYLLFNDSSFNGEEKTLSFYYYPPQFGDNIERYISRHLGNIQLKNVSEEYYFFKTSYLQGLYNQKENALYGMGEPMNVFTNIENGYGVFAGYNDNIVQFAVDETLISTKTSKD
jgi:hypothetical protein